MSNIDAIISAADNPMRFSAKSGGGSASAARKFAARKIAARRGTEPITIGASAPPMRSLASTDSSLPLSLGTRDHNTPLFVNQLAESAPTETCIGDDSLTASPGRTAPITPLALFSSRASISPLTSPRTPRATAIVNDPSPPPSPKTPNPDSPRIQVAQDALTALADNDAILSPRQRLVRSGKARLQRFLIAQKKASGEQSAPASPRTRDRSSTVCAEETLPRAKSLPCSPRQMVLRTEHVVLENSSSERDIDGMLRQPFDNFFTSLRSLDTEGSSLASAESSADESASARDKKKRHSMFVKAANGGSTRFGASGTIEFDDTTKAPLVRVSSHSSIDDLKRRLQAEADALAGIKTPSPPPRKKSSSSSSGSESGSGSGKTLRELVRRKSGTIPKTYTMIEYNPDPLGIGMWQRFMVPNTDIDMSMRTFLERAARSDELNEPYRMCSCSVGCAEHAMPDAVAKLAAVYVVEPSFVTTTIELRAVMNAFRAAHIKIGRGGWAKLYRVQDGNRTNFEQMPCTYHYRYKMFI